MRTIVLTCLIALSVSGFAQKQANVWYFGRKLGLDFNVDPPALLLDGQIDYDDTPDNLEAASSIADENGNLLFYTNGINVWNKFHKVMPNGTGLYGRNTTTQTLIVPKPRSNTIYYIFTASPSSDDSYPIEKIGFHYSVVDLSQDGGLGDVVEKNIKLAESTTEKMAATMHVNGIDVWVVMHEWGNNIFRSYLVTEIGIDLFPIISRTGGIHTGGVSIEDTGNAIGQMKFSTNGEKLALAISRKMQLEVFHFDISKGKLKVSNSISLKGKMAGNLYGIEFSPNGKFIYVTGIACDILQIDIDNRLNQIKINVTTPCNESSQLQLAPNGKIYVAQYSRFIIGAINNPNEKGLLCDYDRGAIEIPIDVNHSCNLGLPNFISSYFYNSELYPPSPYFEMPNVFTPNGDGLNEKFVPMQKYNVASFHIQIYNRWGELIFQTNDIENGWDGGDASSGVYYWFARYTGINDKTYTQKGYVHLLR